MRRSFAWPALRPEICSSACSCSRRRRASCSRSASSARVWSSSSRVRRSRSSARALRRSSRRTSSSRSVVIGADAGRRMAMARQERSGQDRHRDDRCRHDQLHCRSSPRAAGWRSGLAVQRRYQGVRTSAARGRRAGGAKRRASRRRVRWWSVGRWCRAGGASVGVVVGKLPVFRKALDAAVMRPRGLGLTAVDDRRVAGGGTTGARASASAPVLEGGGSGTTGARASASAPEFGVLELGLCPRARGRRAGCALARGGERVLGCAQRLRGLVADAPRPRRARAPRRRRAASAATSAARAAFTAAAALAALLLRGGSLRLGCSRSRSAARLLAVSRVPVWRGLAPSARRACRASSRLGPVRVTRQLRHASARPARAARLGRAARGGGRTRSAARRRQASTASCPSRLGGLRRGRVRRPRTRATRRRARSGRSRRGRARVRRGAARAPSGRRAPDREPSSSSAAACSVSATRSITAGLSSSPAELSSPRARSTRSSTAARSRSPAARSVRPSPCAGEQVRLRVAQRVARIEQLLHRRALGADELVDRPRRDRRLAQRRDRRRPPRAGPSLRSALASSPRRAMNSSRGRP